MAESTKQSYWRRSIEGKFECLLCERQLSSKQRILHHLHNIHKCTPVKREKKKYVDDETAPIPQRTLSRWKKLNRTKRSLNTQYDAANTEDNSTAFHDNEELTILSEDNCFEEHSANLVESNETESTIQMHQNKLPENSTTSNINDDIAELASPSSSSHIDHDMPYEPMSIDEEDLLHVETSCQADDCIIDENLSSSHEDEHGSDDERFSNILEVCSNSSYQLSVRDGSCHSCQSKDSDADSLTDVDLLDYSLSSSDDSLEDYQDSQHTFVSDTELSEMNSMQKTEFQALSLLSCFLRNKFSASACRDVIDTLKRTFFDSEDLSSLDYNKMMTYIESSPMKEIHYCIVCQKMFPEDQSIFRCSTLNCEGLRYKGPISSQQKTGRQPRQCFVLADVKKQLINLLQSDGIWVEIELNKEAAYERAESGNNIITDILDGSAYQEMVKDSGFLDKKEHNITAVFNTDGVNLYSSSKIELWPIFLAINELGPSKRFFRDNILLVGLWQGKGKPPFGEFFKIFSQKMNELRTDGVEIHIEEETYNVKLAVLCGITDLPAKAEVLNMSYFNGEYACILCEDPGITVKQGKGSSRCFPYRIQGSRYPNRTNEDVVSHMQMGSVRNRCQGFKGMSGLAELQGYDLVKGTIPDYMHGVLMGVTKVLLSKWFSPSNSQENYFIGKHLKTISEKMKNIKPPDAIERLPRDLENNFTRFKATELQTWLLYYAIPCVKDYLPDERLENLICLSDGIYILLGDEINPQDLLKASDLLDQFYSSFQRLYGDGSCGLNVHNIGVHLSACVQLWGPIWGWSCFPFEDVNAELLQAVHGTGLVLKQVLNYKNASSCIRKKGLDVKKKVTWKITYEASNCCVAGSLKKLDNFSENLRQQLARFHNFNFHDLQKLDRIIVNDVKFFSEQYSRMQKRVCSVIMYGNDEIGAVEYFVLCNDQVYGVVRKFIRIPLAEGVVMSSHLIPVKNSATWELVDVEKFQAVLVFLNTSSQDDSVCYVARMPSKYGHAVFT